MSAAPRGSEGLRIGDAEREAAIAALGDHYAMGRLTKDEYDERAAVAWSARTNADLAPLFRDLPAARQSPPTAEQRSRAVQPAPRRRSWRPPLLPVLALAIGLALLLRIPFVIPVVIALWWVGFFGGYRGHCGSRS